MTDQDILREERREFLVEESKACLAALAIAYAKKKAKHA